MTPTGSTRRDRWVLVVLSVVFASLALAATLRDGAGTYIADARLENYWAADESLARQEYIWDDHRGLGKVSLQFAPLLGLLTAGLDQLGLAPPAIERTVHAIYLAIAGIGMSLLMTFFRRPVGAEHAFAGLAYMFNPFTSQFLLPSPLFLHYALAPWLLLAVVLGVTRPRERWPWAGLFALAVLAVGSTNPPTLVYAAVPILPVLGYLVWVEHRASSRDVLGFVSRAAVLVCIGSVATIVHLVSSVPHAIENLTTTEVPEAIARTSSWGESWRGLGFFLSYQRVTGALARPHASAFFTDPWTLIGSFVLPILAVGAIWWTRWRARTMFGALVVVGLVLMVGTHGGNDPTPFGRLLRWAFENTSAARGFRSGYKAGPALAMGVAGLFAIGVVTLARRGLRAGAPMLGRVGASAAVAVGVGGLLFGASPFWNGDLYSPVNTFEDIPLYWEEAIETVNDLDEGRVLILPGTIRTRYRWGHVGDDIFEAFIDRTHLMRQDVSEGSPESGSLLEAIDDRTAFDRYAQGSFAPIARRLGIRWVLLRNDLDWRETGISRPSQLDALRDDPDLRLVDTFGAPGEQTFDAGDEGADLLGETDLAPVELYELVDHVPPLRLAPDGQRLLVSGDGEGLVPLASSGLLDEHASFRFTAASSREQLTTDLVAGSELIITDSNRRETLDVRTSHHTHSFTLEADVELDRPTQDIFGRSGSESVVVRDAGSVTATASGHPFRPENWNRPGNAFDGDPTTGWEVTGRDLVGESLRVELDEPRVLPRLTIRQSGSAASPTRITRLTIVRSHGEPVGFDPGTGPTEVELGTETISWFEVRIDRVSGPREGRAGIAEIEAPGLDLRGRIQLPDDVFRFADGDRAFEATLGFARVSYQFDRRIRLGAQEEELDVDRRFRVLGKRQLRPSAVLQLSAQTDDDAIHALIGGTYRAVGSDRRSADGRGWGGEAVDGSLGTAWLAPAAEGEHLDLSFPETGVTVLEIELIATNEIFGPQSLPRRIEVSVGDSTVDCTPGPGSVATTRLCRVEIPRQLATQARITLGAIDAVRSGALTDDPVAVAEVRVIGDDGPVTGGPVSRLLDARCVELGELDGSPVEVRLHGTVEDLLSGSRINATSCSDLELETGFHDFDSNEQLRASISEIVLRDVRALGDPSEAGQRFRGQIDEPGADIEIRDDQPTRMSLVVTSPEDATVVMGESHSSDWVASIDGGPAIPATNTDTFSSWVLPGPGRHSLEITYRPQRTYELGLISMAAVMAWSLAALPALAARRFTYGAAVTSDLDPGADAMDDLTTRITTAHITTAHMTVIGVVGLVIGGVSGAAAALAIAAMLRRGHGSSLVGTLLTGSVAAVAIATILPGLASSGADIAQFVDDRPAADLIGRLAAAGLAAAVLVLASRQRHSSLRRLPGTEPATADESAISSTWCWRAFPLGVAAVTATLVATSVGTAAFGVAVTAASALTVLAVGAIAVRERRQERGEVAAQG